MGGGAEGGAALPALHQELEEGARQEEERQREKAKQIFISQVTDEARAVDPDPGGKNWGIKKGNQIGKNKNIVIVNLDHLRGFLVLSNKKKF